MKYSKILKAIRAQLLLSQTDLAKQIGMSRITISRIEQGVYNPSIFNQKKILEFCKKNKLDPKVLEDSLYE